MAGKKYLRVLDLVKAGCNTSRDIADAFPMTTRGAAAYLLRLERFGLVRRTGRVIASDGGRPLLVWEAV